MAKTTFSEHEVINILSKNHYVNVKEYDKVIEILVNAPIGNKTNGKIDFLVSKGFVVIKVNKINKRLFTKDNNNSNDDNIYIKHNKREKFNMSVMTKNAMKRNK